MAIGLTLEEKDKDLSIISPSPRQVNNGVHSSYENRASTSRFPGQSTTSNNHDASELNNPLGTRSSDQATNTSNPTPNLEIGGQTPKPDSLRNFMVKGHAEEIWKEARNTFFSAERANIRAKKYDSWAKEGLIPPWAIGKETCPHTDADIANITGIQIFEQGRELLYSLSNNQKKSCI